MFVGVVVDAIVCLFLFFDERVNNGNECLSYFVGDSKKNKKLLSASPSLSIASSHAFVHLSPTSGTCACKFVLCKYSQEVKGTVEQSNENKRRAMRSNDLDEKQASELHVPPVLYKG